ncbi:MAG: hypothetical protein QE280_03265 [Caulobacter sp.]|nr:hypothetical protein [Caulobacter sp.]
MLAELGLTVARQIPLSAIPHIMSGAYKVFPGVIRDGGGRIVMHLAGTGTVSALAGLVPGLGVISDLVQNVQLWKLAKDVEQVQSTVETVLSISAAGASMSGLGMVTSIAGFAYMSRRMDQIDKKLDVLTRDVKEIRELIESSQRSKLHFAINNLRHAEQATDEKSRSDLLIQSKREFNILTNQYKQQWSRCRTPREIEAIDDLYTLAMIGHATVCSNLGMMSEAALDLRSNYMDWVRQARMHARAVLFDNRAEQILSAEYLDLLPARKLTELLDFVHDSNRGIDWIDDLRVEAAKTYSPLELLPVIRAQLGSMGSKSSLPLRVETAQTLLSRASVLEATTAHFDFLNEKKISSSAFQQQLEAERSQSGADMICVYAEDVKPALALPPAGDSDVD